MKKFLDRNTSFILVLMVAYCLLSISASSIGMAVACNRDANCDGVEFDKGKFLTDESIKKQREILAVLFDLSEEIVLDKTFYDYNYYGDSCDFSPKWKDGCAYNGGHPGWDAQTQDKSTDQVFYSLTKGVVILDGRKGEDNTDDETKFNAIAIYDEDNNRTTLYLHASDVRPEIKKGEKVKVCDPLGNQGDTGSSGAVHVHLEVQEGEAKRASAGTKDAGTQTIDPISYLHESIEERPFKLRIIIEKIFAKLKIDI